MNPSKTKTSFYRRLYVALLIADGTDTVPAIIQRTGMPRRTAQDTILSLAELDIQCDFHGATRNGHYVIADWGLINPDRLRTQAAHIARVLGYPSP